MFRRKNNPANIRLDEDVFRLRLQKTSSKCLHQGEYIRFTHTSSEDIFKTFSRRLDQDQYIRLGHTCSSFLQDVLIKTNIFILGIRLQGVVKTFSRRLQDVLPRLHWNIFKTSCKNVLKISSRRFQEVFKTSSRRLAKMSSRCFQDVLKTSSRRLGNMFSGRFQDVSSS